MDNMDREAVLREQEEYAALQKQRRRETWGKILVLGIPLVFLMVVLGFILCNSLLPISHEASESEPYTLSGTVKEKGRDETGELHLVLEYYAPGQSIRSTFPCSPEVYDNVKLGDRQTFLCQFNLEHGRTDILRIGSETE